METSRPGPIRRLIVGLWDAVNFSRRLVFNALFLLVLAVFLAALLASPRVHTLQKRTALVLDLDGTLVEQYTSSALDRAIERAAGDHNPELQLRDLLQVIAAAKDDKRIERLVLRTDGFDASGFAALRELGAALREFRSSGKQIVAYGTGMEQKAYYLAAQADEVYLDPEGAVVLEGLGRYRLYYREGLQEKLGVDVQLFRVGEFKSAAEPYILDAASPEAREADLFWMGDVWQRYLDDIASARKLDAAALAAMINDMPARVQAAKGDLARLALDAKLVDALKTEQEVDDLLTERGVADDDDGFRQIAYEDYLRQQKRPQLGAGDQPQVAVVVAQGEILPGRQGQGTIGGDSTAELLRQAHDDEAVKAVVLRVDSPGGAVFASEQIRREVIRLRAAGKPVIASMSNYAASGGYWISMNADRIFADESTITGSIGIFGLWLSMPRVLEKIGVRSDGVGTTPLAGAFDPTRPFDPQLGTIIQAVIDKGYADFTRNAAEARGRSVEEIDAVARGRVWTGAQAKERGLIDEFGGLRAAIADAAKRAKLKPDQYRVNYIEKPLGGFEKFLVDMDSEGRLAGLLRVLGPNAAPGLDRKTLQRIDSELGWLDRRGPMPFKTVAHCFCGL